MKQKALFHGHMTAVASEAHPFQSRLRFVFTDYEPNVNGQGVQKSEAGNILRTGVHMPIKVHFKGDGVGNHFGAIPVGPITSMYEDNDRIIGEAIIWKEAYGDVVEYLEKASAEEGGVQFSWELYYADSVVEDSVEWLKDVTVAAATIVDLPSYKGRTPLLSFASERQELIEEIEQLKSRIAALEVDSAEDQEVKMNGVVATAAHVDPDAGVVVAPSGTDVVPAEHKQQKDSRESVDTGAATPVAASNDLEDELRELREFKARVESEARERELANNRASQLAEAGVEVTDFTSASFILRLEDSAFEEFVSFVRNLKASASSSATASVASEDTQDADTNDILPDPVTGGKADSFTFAQLGQALRELKSNTAKKEV